MATVCVVDDLDYQAFRRYTRDPGNQRAFLSLPLAARRVEAERLRAKSQGLARLKTEEIMDVSASEVGRIMRQHNVLHLIHGHTHRPAIHHINVDGIPGKRTVLSDWYDQGSVLVCDHDGCRHTKLEQI